VARSQVDRLIT